MKSKLRVLGWLAGGVALTFVVAALIVMVAVKHSRTELIRYRAELEKRGERFDPANYAAPKAPTENNGGSEILTTIEALQKTERASWQFATTPQETKLGRFVVRHKRPEAQQGRKYLAWSDVTTSLNAAQPQLAVIRRAAQSPVLAVDVDYEKKPYDPDPSIDFISTASLFFSMDTLLRLRTGDTAGALENIETILRLARLPGRHALGRSQDAAFYTTLEAMHCTWEFLQSDRATTGDLTWLQAAWEGAKPIVPASQCLRMERAMSLQQISEALDKFTTSASFPKTWDEAKGMSQVIPWLIIYRHADEKEFLEIFQDTLDTMPPGQPISYRDAFAVTSRYEYPSDKVETSRLISSYFSQGATKILERYATMAAMQSLTVTAIALRRYQLDHGGALPSDLAGLVPKYLSTLPRDPMDQEPLRYRTGNDGFVLYSLGLNGSDEGGSSAIDPKKGDSWWQRTDIVWPRAAAP